jgi:hypothetical protein
MNVESSDGSSGAKLVKQFSSGMSVRVKRSGPIPTWSKCDDDRGRTSGAVKRRLQQQFFRGEKRLRAEIAWITSESERDELARKGRVKVKVKESAGTTLVFIAGADNLEKA